MEIKIPLPGLFREIRRITYKSDERMDQKRSELFVVCYIVVTVFFLITYFSPNMSYEAKYNLVNASYAYMPAVYAVFVCANACIYDSWIDKFMIGFTILIPGVRLVSVYTKLQDFIEATMPGAGRAYWLAPLFLLLIPFSFWLTHRFLLWLYHWGQRRLDLGGEEEHYLQ